MGQDEQRVQQAAWHASQHSSASLEVGPCAIFTHQLSGLLNRHQLPGDAMVSPSLEIFKNRSRQPTVLNHHITREAPDLVVPAV